MSRRHLSFTEKRRHRHRKQVDRLDRLETRNTITEPISVLGLSVSALRGMVQLGIMHPNGGSNAVNGLMRPLPGPVQAQKTQPVRSPSAPGGSAESSLNSVEQHVRQHPCRPGHSVGDR